MNDQELTPEERAFGEKLDAQLYDVEAKLNKIGIEGSMIEQMLQKKEKPEEMPQMPQQLTDKIEAMLEMPTIDRRGRWVMTGEQVQQRFHNSYPIIRYRELPLCWSNFKDKIIFNIPMTFIAGYTYEVLHIKKRNLNLADIGYKKILRSWGVAFVFAFGISLIDSLYFDDYCDVSSYHYQELDRKRMMRDIRERLK